MPSSSDDDDLKTDTLPEDEEDAGKGGSNAMGGGEGGMGHGKIDRLHGKDGFKMPEGKAAGYGLIESWLLLYWVLLHYVGLVNIVVLTLSTTYTLL